MMMVLVSAEVKRSRLVSDEDSGSDEGSGAPDKSLAAKLKELGSDSEDEDDTMKRDAGKKNEKALFGSDSDSGDDEEESVMHFIGLSARVCVCVCNCLFVSQENDRRHLRRVR